MEKKTTVISPEALQRQEGFCGRVREYWQAQGITPVAFVETYGCQQNEADSEQIRGMLEHCGYGLTDGPEGADLVIFNTCAIREHAEQRVFGNVGALVHTRRRHPRQKIFLCGCMMGQPAVVERVRKSYPYVDGVFSTHHLWELPQLLLGVLTTGKRVFSVEDSAGAIAEGLPVVRENKLKAWVSVMYGCNNFCTYCIVPYVRGRERSRQPEDILQECRALIAQGGFFLEGENLTRVKAVMERGNGSMNPAIVGRDAMTIARIAGIEVPAGTRLLISDEQGVGAKFPFSKEKLTALLGFYVVNDWHQACELCHALLHNCGIGHSLAIHSNNEDVIREFGLKKPVSRILVNTPSTQGGVGLTTALFPSFTLGCGAVGGSATSDNVTPMNLLNIRRVAYDLGSSMCRHHDCHAEAPKSCCSAASSCANAAGTSSIDINAITSLIVAELKKVM